MQYRKKESKHMKMESRRKIVMEHAPRESLHSWAPHVCFLKPEPCGSELCPVVPNSKYTKKNTPSKQSVQNERPSQEEPKQPSATNLQNQRIRLKRYLK
jgi:hypothetical protein